MCLGTVEWLKKINAFPKDGKPITSTKNSEYEVETIFSEFAQIIHKIVNNKKEGKKPISLNYYLRNVNKIKREKTDSEVEASSMSISSDGKLQVIRGNNNIQVGGDYITHESSATRRIKILPPPESIGTDSLLKQRIQILFNQIGQEREKRFGKRAYSVMYKNSKQIL